MDGWDSIAEKWADQWHGLRPWQVRERVEFAKRVENSLVLDLGCGYGRDVGFFNGLGLTYVGIDFSKGMLILAGDKGVLVRASVDAVPFRDECFDALWCCSVMRYLDDEAANRCMCEANRVLKPKGLFWLSLEHGSKPRTEVKHGASFMAQLFDEDRIIKLAAATGFKILETKKHRKWRRFLVAILEKNVAKSLST